MPSTDPIALAATYGALAMLDQIHMLLGMPAIEQRYSGKDTNALSAEAFFTVLDTLRRAALELPGLPATDEAKDLQAQVAMSLDPAFFVPQGQAILRARLAKIDLPTEPSINERIQLALDELRGQVTQ